jgi:uncharacterized protein
VFRFAVLLSVGLSAGCNHTPAEEFPSRGALPTSPIAAPSTDKAAAVRGDGAVGSSDPLTDRCVHPTPAEEPRPVAPGPAPGCPKDPEAAPPRVPVVAVAFPEAGGAFVDAELVRSEHDTMRGLMYRTRMDADRGMLFDLRVRDDHKFWMHNTCIPLDILYVDDDGLIVGIVENAPTLNDESRGVGCPSRWVLEVNAGWSRTHGVKAGQHMTIPAEARR